MSLKVMEKMSSKRRQAGMTTLGLIILVSFLGLFAFAGIRLTPVYLNYMKVVGVIDGVDEEFDGTGATSTAIRKSISRRFDIESVAVITAKDINVKKTAEGHEVVVEGRAQSSSRFKGDKVLTRCASKYDANSY